MTGEDAGPAVRLDELATVLHSCRDTFLSMFGLGFQEPSAGSHAHGDELLLLQGADGNLWPKDILRQPRAIAVKLLRQQADYCVALGQLIGEGEAWDPASTLARSIVEYAARIYWVLEPTAEHRSRCTRAELMELVSLHHARDAAKDMPADDDLNAHRELAAAGFKQMKNAIKQRYTNVEMAREPWTIEGQAYPSWTDATKAWSAAHGTGFDGGALYKLLAVLAHPQGFSATFGLTFDADGTGTRSIELARVEILVQLAMAAFYSGLRLVANYTGHEPPVLLEWEAQIERVLPRIFGAEASDA